jgi:glycosyltransferase involved in cell wall biosynthesis
VHVLLMPSWFPRRRGDSGGIFFLEQAEALHQYGHRIGVLAQYAISLKDLLVARAQPESRTTDGLVIYRDQFIVWLPKVPTGTFHLCKATALKQFKRYCENHGRPDVIHAHSVLYGGAIATRVGEVFGIPVVLTEHSSIIGQGRLRTWERRLVLRTISDTDACIAVSNSLAADLKSNLDFSGHIEVVPNLVSDRFISHPLAPRIAGKASARIVSVGSLDSNKAQSNLIIALVDLVKRYKSIELYIVGEGPERAALRALARNLGISERVRFFGSISPEKVPDVVYAADVLVVSSLYETFGLAAAEALALGTPVVSTPCGGPSDIIASSDGVIVAERSPAALAAGIAHVIENPEQYDRIEISTRARSRFNGFRVAERLTKIYSRVLGQ